MKFTGYFKDTMKKQYEKMKGVYKLNPDANVHFLAFDKNYLYFSPR